MSPPSIAAAAATTDRSGAHAAASRLLLGLAGVLLTAAVVGVPAWVFNDYFDHKAAAATEAGVSKLDLQAQRHDLDATKKQLEEEIAERKKDRRILRAIAKKLRVPLDDDEQ